MLQEDEGFRTRKCRVKYSSVVGRFTAYIAFHILLFSSPDFPFTNIMGARIKKYKFDIENDLVYVIMLLFNEYWISLTI